MNPQQQQALLDVAKTALGSLPVEGQIEVFKHLDTEARNRIVSGALATMSDESRRQLLSVYPKVPTDTEVQPSVSNEGIHSLITQAGGIFIGQFELLRLGQIKDTDVVPAIPEKYSKEFLEATHPIRGGTIASHCILGFDVESKQWLCVDRGEGGESDIVPGSLDLSGNKQDKILQKIAPVSGCKIESPNDSHPVEHILDNAVILHLKDGKPISTAPFRNIWARTADTERGASGCRVLLGDSNEGGVDVSDLCHSAAARSLVGLLAAWN